MAWHSQAQGRLNVSCFAWKVPTLTYLYIQWQAIQGWQLNCFFLCQSFCLESANANVTLYSVAGNSELVVELFHFFSPFYIEKFYVHGPGLFFFRSRIHGFKDIYMFSPPHIPPVLLFSS